MPESIQSIHGRFSFFQRGFYWDSSQTNCGVTVQLGRRCHKAMPGCQSLRSMTEFLAGQNLQTVDNQAETGGR